MSSSEGRPTRIVLPHIHPHRVLIISLIIIMCTTTAAQIVGPGLLGQFIDMLVDGAPVSDLTLQGAIFGISQLVGAVGGVGVVAVGGRVAWRVSNAIREDLLRHCLNQDAAFFARHTPGELNERINSDVEKLAKLLSRLVVMLGVNGLLLAGVIVGLMVVDPVIGTGFAALIAVGSLLARRLVGDAVEAQIRASRASAALSGYLDDRLRGLEDTVPNGGSGELTFGAHVRSKALFLRRRFAVRLQVRWPKLLQHLNTGALGFALAVALIRYYTDIMTIGEVFAVVGYVLLARTPMVAISVQMADLDDSLAALRRIRSFRAIDPPEWTGSRSAPHKPCDLSIRDATVAYGDQIVLDGLTLSVEAGERLFVIGRSGAGKSTLLSLIQGRVWPNSGTVDIGGIPVEELERDAIRSLCLYVPQQSSLLTTSLRNNLTLFDETISDERMTSALAAVGLAEWHSLLPGGFDCILDVEHTPSVGQVRLLAMARALLVNPRIVLLDEPFAGISPSHWASMSAALDVLTAGRSTIIVTHVIENISDDDEVALLRNGAIATRGRWSRIKGKLAPEDAHD